MGHPILKSIHPVNLLSFGPKTEPIELRPLNILIGPNGSGKSNFIEVIRLLHFLPDKDPWSAVLATGGVSEWIWKGAKNRNPRCSLRASFSLASIDKEFAGQDHREFDLLVDLERYQSSFRVSRESIGTIGDMGERDSIDRWFDRSGSQGTIHLRLVRGNEGPIAFDVNPDRSILSQLASPSIQASGIGRELPELFEIAELLESFDFHQDWEFGADCPPRAPSQQDNLSCA